MQEETEFYKYPRIAHIAGSKHTSDDIVWGDIPEGEFMVFEKTDGANSGISMPQAYNFLIQNRGEYIQNKRKHEQWSALQNYVHACGEKFIEAFSHYEGRSIIFGEWLYAVHSVVYDDLPDLFIPFDVWEPSRGLVRDYNNMSGPLTRSGFTPAKPIATTKSIATFIKKHKVRPQSLYGEDRAEGFIFRDVEDYSRVFKYVYPEFTNGITGHWFNQELRRNTTK